MLDTSSKKKVETFIHPSGFVEQHYSGYQTLNSVLSGLRDLEKHVNKVVKDQGKPALILVDTTALTKVDLSRKMLGARQKGVQMMKDLDFKKAAIYGPLAIQILVNTMAKIAGVSNRIHVFENRVDAICWLKSKQ
ncbi:MAG TPA: hypothetical protein VFW52_01085 [Candidatus Saccharimonadales bacterium]|nr:hypothetical protein [Candidatus Saccharimonadales bacterium]